MKKIKSTLVMALAALALMACDTAAATIGDSVKDFTAVCSSVDDCDEKMKALEDEIFFVGIEALAGDITLRQGRDKTAKMEAEHERLEDRREELVEQERELVKQERKQRDADLCIRDADRWGWGSLVYSCWLAYRDRWGSLPENVKSMVENEEKRLSESKHELPR